MDRLCHRCRAAVGPSERVGRREACPKCGADLHCCMNCRFHDPQRHNACRESQAERQVDKEVGNFCEYFAFREFDGGAADGAAARARLDAMFRRPGK